jgi:hypothetical protein
MPLWFMTYFKLKTTEKNQTQEELSALPSRCLKVEHKFPFVKVSSSPVPSQEQDKSYH